ncbi:MAG: FmdB family zinc ribbon protein [Dehalococcoidia bacterium]
MPIYEYRCNACAGRLSHFQRSVNQTVSPTCPHCQSHDLQRLISQFAVVRSVEDAFDDSDFGDLGMDDPAAMASMAGSMGDEMGYGAGGIDDGLGEFAGGGYGEDFVP